MDSTDSTSSPAQRFMPMLAIFRHDLRALRASWLVRLWLGATVLLTLLMMAVAWATVPTARLMASLLFPYLVFPWFPVVMVLGVTPVSGANAETLVDGFLSRPITRSEYLLAVLAARVATVLGVYLVVMVPALALVATIKRHAPADPVSAFGIVAALAVVGVVLALQVSLSFLMGTVLRKPLLAIVVLLFLWYPVNFVLSIFQLQSFSPVSLDQAMPRLLRQPWKMEETPESQAEKGLAAALDAARQMNWSSLVPGGAPERREPGGFYDHPEDYEDFSLTRVLLGYGIPTLLCVAVAVGVFTSRDL
jgi:ABC-type transport system involved in multi-copper enzyme maturation permease subunit